jgi:hypothetical protein
MHDNCNVHQLMIPLKLKLQMMTCNNALVCLCGVWSFPSRIPLMTIMDAFSTIQKERESGGTKLWNSTSCCALSKTFSRSSLKTCRNRPHESVFLLPVQQDCGKNARKQVVLVNLQNRVHQVCNRFNSCNPVWSLIIVQYLHKALKKLSGEKDLALNQQLPSGSRYDQARRASKL